MDTQRQAPSAQGRASVAPERPGAERVGLRIPSLARALLDWRGARDRVDQYLRRLGLDEAVAEATTRGVLERALEAPSEGSAAAETLDEGVRTLLAEHPLEGEPAAIPLEQRFLRWRFAAWQQGSVGAGPLAAATELEPTPPLARSPMAPERFQGRRLGEPRRRSRRAASARAVDPARAARRRARSPWNRTGHGRRAILTALVVFPSIAAGYFFIGTLPGRVWLPAEVVLAIFFGALFGWISLGFWTAAFGFMVLMRGGDGFSITRQRGEPPREGGALDPEARTALVMPICDESVERVFAGLRATRDSLEATGAGDRFDLFILSDSADPDIASDELSAWAEWRRSLTGRCGLFYRRRRVRLKRKSGNIADFCRRFGKRYRYMIVLDADSVMSGETLVRLVELMEAHPRVGIIQTAPRVIRARSLFARVQQLANQLYGPMFAAGLHYWQLGDCPYWGHNAILRMEPFMKHGALPRLAGKPPFGGDILSHDFVEAALLGRAGYSVWLAFDVGGSWEETPESLLEEMKRDQRWCQGNLQHLRLIFTEGLAPTHRALFLNGIFAYVSAALWLGFLVASTVEAALWSFVGPDYFSAGRSLFPTWPVWRPERVEGLVGAVACVLFLPKFLAILLQLRTDGAASFGGPARLMKSVFAESLASALLAPVRMAFYSRFVIRNLLGQAVGWRGGADDQGETTWRAAWRHHGADVATATVWAAGVYWLHPSAFWWLMPVAGALVLSAPLSVLASRARLGDRVAAHGWLASPEALRPPPVLAALEARLASPDAVPTGGFRAVVVDPLRNAVHGILTRGPRNYSAGMQSVRAELIERAVAGGPDVLSVREKRFLLGDATSLVELHRRVWRLDDPENVERWGLLAGPAEPAVEGAAPVGAGA